MVQGLVQAAPKSAPNAVPPVPKPKVPEPFDYQESDGQPPSAPIPSEKPAAAHAIRNRAPLTVPKKYAALRAISIIIYIVSILAFVVTAVVCIAMIGSGDGGAVMMGVGYFFVGFFWLLLGLAGGEIINVLVSIEHEARLSTLHLAKQRNGE